LVTGASGFVGAAVARALVREGWQVRALARPGSDRRNIQALPVEVSEGNLADRPSLDRALSGCEALFHVAADYRLGAPDPRQLYQTNVDGTRNILEASRQAGVRRVVYTSSVATVGIPTDGSPGNEDTPVSVGDMIGHYKRSKFLAEQEALAAAVDGLPVVVVNPTTPVGPGDSKPTPTGQIIVDFLSGRMPAYVDTGLNVVAVEDVAAGHLLAAERGRVGERYVLGGRNMTLKQILDVLSDVSRRAAPRLRIPHIVALAAAYADQTFSWMAGREPRIPLEGVRMARHKMFVDSSKAARELGYETTPVERALERAVQWYERNDYVGVRRQHRLAQAQAA
jgi:dihydroflavonol-4-reductase